MTALPDGIERSIPDRHLSRLRTLDENLETYLAMGFILVYASLIVYKIVSRLVLDAYSFVWLQKVIIGLFVWAAWLSTASLVRSDDHIRFSSVLSRLPRTGVYAVYWIEWAIWVALSGIILRYSIPYVRQFVQSGSTITGTSVPVSLLYLSLPVGFGLILLRTLQQIVLVTGKYRRGEPMMTGSDLSGGE
ncbi:MAG: TRAP transporter small permease [Halanaeroarchaeum sp.]